MRWLVCNPTIQYIFITRHTKYDNASLHCFTVIFDEKLHYSKNGKKKNQKNKWKNKQKTAGSQSHNTIYHYPLHTKYYNDSLQCFTEIFDEKFHYLKYGKKRYRTNKGKNKYEKAGLQSHDTIHHYQPAYHI